MHKKYLGVKSIVSRKPNCTFLEIPPKAHTPRKQRAKWVRLPDPTHAGTTYPRSGEPLTPIFCAFVGPERVWKNVGKL